MFNSLKKFLFVLTAGMFTIVQTFAVPRGGQTLVPAGHYLYDAVQALELETGLVLLTDYAPLSIEEFRAVLTHIDYEELSECGKANYDSILSYFNDLNWSLNASVVSVGIEPEVNPEVFVKTDDNIPWVRDRFERRNFIELPVQIAAGDYAFINVDIDVTLNKTALTESGNYANVPYSGETFDINFPHNAYFSAGTKISDTAGFNLKLGNFRQSFGRAATGSVILSEYLTDTTTLELKVYSECVDYAASIVELNTRRYMYLHKIDIRPAKKFSISLLEGCLPYGGLDLKFMNPAMIFHGYAAWKDYQETGSDVGSYFGAKFNVITGKYVRIYGLFSMTQFQTPMELSSDETDPANLVPNAMGFQLGAESYIPVNKGQLHFNLEGYYGQPYLYINDNPNWSFVRTYKENFNGSNTFYEYVGAKYGPDTVACDFKAEYEVPQKWNLGMKYLFLARGELSSPDIFKAIGWGGNNFSCSKENCIKNWVYPNTDGKGGYTHKTGREYVAPTGTPELVHVFSIKGEYHCSKWASVFMQPAVAFVTNAGHKENTFNTGFECTVGAQFRLTKIK